MSITLHEFEGENDLKELLLLLDEGDGENQILSNSSVRKRRRSPNKYYRKPPFRPSFMPELRILKRDIRRSYPDMLNNVMNSHDVNLFSSFVDRFYSGECTMVQIFPENAPACFNSIKIQGAEALKRKQRMNDLVTPDSVINVSNSQVCKRLHENGSRVLGNFDVAGTGIYLPKEYNGRPVDPNDLILNYDVDHNEFLALEKPEDFFQKFQLAKKPLNMQVKGSYEMILDANHRVERLTISWLSFNISQSSFLNYFP